MPFQAVEATKNVELGNKELSQAIQRNSSSRTFLLLFLFVLTFSILFLDWYSWIMDAGPPPILSSRWNRLRGCTTVNGSIQIHSIQQDIEQAIAPWHVHTSEMFWTKCSIVHAYVNFKKTQPRAAASFFFFFFLCKLFPFSCRRSEPQRCYDHVSGSNKAGYCMKYMRIIDA